VALVQAFSEIIVRASLDISIVVITEKVIIDGKFENQRNSSHDGFKMTQVV
jgi:hypothetical protein